MPIPASNYSPPPGDVFVRNSNAPTTPAFFTETITIQNARSDGKAIFWPAGTPLITTAGNTPTASATTPNGLTSTGKFVYTPVTLQPGVPTKVCVIDCKGQSFTAPNAPVAMAGIRINLTRLPLTVPDNAAAGLQRVYVYNNWKTQLASTKLNIPYFEESSRFDPSQT